jgi:S1-C subfamily serine protease
MWTIPAMSPMRRLVSVLALSALGCGGAAAAPPPATAPQASATPAPEIAAPAPSSLRRSTVKQAIGLGVGAFLQNVAVADWPAMKDGKFYGWTIKAIRNDWGVDIRPGDVVTRVNGMPIEHPEEADAALRSLEKAKALKVDYERDGAAKTLELPIVDD